MADGLQLVEALKQGVKHYKSLASEQATRIDALEKELLNQRRAAPGDLDRDRDRDQDRDRNRDQEQAPAASPGRHAEARAEIARLRTKHAEAEAEWERQKLALLKQRDGTELTVGCRGPFESAFVSA